MSNNAYSLLSMNVVIPVLLCLAGCSGSGQSTSQASVTSSSHIASASSVSSSSESSASSSPALTVSIAANDPAIRYRGRVALSNESAAYDWANTQIEFSVDASELELLLDDGLNDYNLYIDGELHSTIATVAGRTEYRVALDQGEHHLLLGKRTGPNFGPGRFLGLRLPEDAQMLSLPPEPERKIEFIGDSYTVGYGNEGPGLDCGGVLRPYENSYQSYAAIAARALDAQSHSIAISGFGAARNYADTTPVSDTPMPHYYHRTLMGQEDLSWDFSAWVPDAVVIKLGTNDHSTEPRPEAGVFIQAIHDLIGQVVVAYGQVPVFLLADSSMELVIDRLQTAAQEQAVMGNNQVYFVQVNHPPQSQLGCDWHPLVAGHEAMAAELVEAMRPILHW